MGLTEFGLAMVAATLAFASGPWLRSLVTGIEPPTGHLLFDGRSPERRALARLIVAADPDRLIRAIDTSTADVSALPPGLTPAEAHQSLLLVRADGRTTSGPDAFLIVARWLPLLWPVGLLGVLPGVRHLLRRLIRGHALDESARPPRADEVPRRAGGGVPAEGKVRGAKTRPMEPTAVMSARSLAGSGGPGRDPRPAGFDPVGRGSLASGASPRPVPGSPGQLRGGHRGHLDV